MTPPADQLDAMLALRPNWDGYGATPPDPAIVRLAKLVVALYQELPTVRNIRVHPTRVGGVQVEWETATTESELELAPDGSFGALHADKRTGQAASYEFGPGSQSQLPAWADRVRELTRRPTGGVAMDPAMRGILVA